MDDIEAVIRFTPQEQIQFEKEQNIYSIVKTIEFLVSHSRFFNLLKGVCILERQDSGSSIRCRVLASLQIV